MIRIVTLREAQPSSEQRPTFRHYLAYLIVVHIWPVRWLNVLWHPKFSEDFPLLAAAGFYAFWEEPDEDAPAPSDEDAKA